MARLPYIDPAQASPSVRETLEAAPDLHIFRLMANAETAFRPWMRFAGVLLTDLELDPVLRELAILRVAAVTPGADYEWVQHEDIARSVGATEAQIAGARSGDGLDGDAALVVRFAEEVVRDVKPSDATFAAASARFSPREIVELLLVVGQYMLIARVAATAEIDPDEPGDFANVERLRRAGGGGTH